MHSLLKKRILSVCLFSSCMLQKYKNGHLYRLFSSDICNSSPKKTYRKPTENLQKTYKKSGNGILFICLIANCEICGTNLLTSELYIPTFTSNTKVMKKRVSAVVIVLVCLGGVACIKTLSTSSVGLPQLAFDNIEALASGESSAYRCYGIGDVDCHGDKVDKMYSGYSLK